MEFLSISCSFLNKICFYFYVYNQLLYPEKHKTNQWWSNATMQSHIWNPWHQQQQSPPPRQPPSKTRTRTTRTTHAYPGHNRLANVEEGWTGEGEPKPPQAPKKVEPHSQETARTLLITLMNLMPHFQPDPMMPPTMMMYLRTLRELCAVKRKAVERKERLWQLLLQRSGMPATPIVLVVAAPFFSVPFVTSIPRTFPRAPPSSSRSGYHEQQRKRNQGRVQDIRSGGCEKWLMVWSTHIHVLEGPSRQRSNAGAWYEQQLHWVVQNPWDTSRSCWLQNQETNSKEEIK